MIPGSIPLGLGAACLFAILLNSVRLRRGGVSPWAFNGRDDVAGFLGRVLIAICGTYAGLLLWNAFDQAALRSHLGATVILPTAWAEGIGTGLMVVGLGLVVWAQLAMGRSWRVGIPEHDRTALIMDGPFRFSRNPVFLGFQLAAVGVALAVSTAPTWALFGATYLALSVQVRLEEQHLRALHPELYPAYEVAVPRWFIPLASRTRRLNVASI